MSEKLLSGACDDCPLRKKINCDAAERITTRAARASDGTDIMGYPIGPVSLSLSYEFCDNPNDENAPRYEIKANNAEKYLAAADEVEQALQSDPKFDMPKRRLGDIDASIRHMSAVRILQDARHNSLKSSIADEFTQCEAPVEDETSWFRRKKCGADVVGRVLPRSEMVKRNEEAELMRKYGTTGFVAVSKLQKFKPIR